MLDKSLLIDDVAAPLAVEIECVPAPSGHRQSRKFVMLDGARCYLDERRDIARLGEKALRVQDGLKGIANAVGGDHTTDLSRLLRIPGTLNRKDQRNGQKPVPSILVECEPTRRYEFQELAQLSGSKPVVENEAKTESTALAGSHNQSLPTGSKLVQFVAACAAAPPGRRSEADFALICHAIKKGIDQDLLWKMVESIGKFAEQGRRYFDLTWRNAEVRVHSESTDGLASNIGLALTTTDTTRVAPASVDSDSSKLAVQRDHSIIRIDAATTPVAVTLRRITDSLLAARNVFVRCGQLVAVYGELISAILTPAELFGLLSEHVEFVFVNGNTIKYRPLSPNYCGTWLHNHFEKPRIPEITLFAKSPVITTTWRLVAPGFDKETGTYYAGPAVAARNGTDHLDLLLGDFCFKSEADRTNFLGILLTGLLVPHFIGSRPAALFTGNQPGIGKSSLAQIVAILRDGAQVETVSYNPNDEEFEKRLGALVRFGLTTIIIDNAKGRGRSPRIESACLERSITDPVLSFRLLGHSESIRAENSHVFCITANTPDVSRDLVTRSVVIRLHYEGDPERRRFLISDPEDYARRNRIELLGELIGMVERWHCRDRPMADVPSRFNKRRWGNIVGGILSVNGASEFLANAEEASSQMDETEREFAELVSMLAEGGDRAWTAAELVAHCSEHQLLALTSERVRYALSRREWGIWLDGF